MGSLCLLNVMSFGLCNAPVTFQNVITNTFSKYLDYEFMQIFLEYFNFFNTKEVHLK